MQSDFDNNLQSYFTDMEHLRGMFKEYVVAPSLPKRIIVIHGVGGSGKSSLLRMFRIHCKSEKIPVALASGDDTKSIFDVITRWMDDLKEDGVKFSSLIKTIEAYRTIQAKVDDQTKKTQNAGGRMADIASKAASKTAETAGGALLGAAIGSVIPGVGTAIGGALGGVVSGMGAEALTDWLRGFLTKPDIDLLLDPAKRLTTDFLADIAKAAEKKRLVLLLDTYEQMTALEDLIGEVAQKIHPNILMVVAGRKLPEWNRMWQGWMASAQIEELKPMTEDIMRQLIRRYYSTMRGGEPNSAQVETIIRFARGLPMVVTSAVQLWVKYGVEDFQSVKAEIVANLVDRLMEGVPSNLIPALEAAAVVRWFDQPILRAVTGLEDVRNIYNDLRRFPFVRTRAEGLALHDSVREMMDENLRVQDSERHSNLHERAAVYFEKQLEKLTGDEFERLKLEYLYHHIFANEVVGINLFQETAEELTRSHQINRLRFLLNDITSYDKQLVLENSRLWIRYYKIRLINLEGNWVQATEMYSDLYNQGILDKKLLAYTLCDWAYALSTRELVFQQGIGEKVIRLSQQSLEALPELDEKLILNYRTQSDIYYLIWAQWDKAFELLEKARLFYKEKDSNYGQALILKSIQTLSAVRGDWKRMLSTRSQGLALLPKQYNRSSLYAELLAGWSPAYAWTGRYANAESNTRLGISIATEVGEIDIRGYLRDLSLILAFEGKHKESKEYIEKGFALGIHLGRSTLDRSTTLRWQAVGEMRAGDSESAYRILEEVIDLVNQAAYTPSMGEIFAWQGLLNELRKDWLIALSCYQQSLKFRGRQYFECAALTGLVRVKHAQGDYVAITSPLAEAEQLAQKHEYNDHLASLRLTQGHLAWKTDNKDDAISFYKHAIIYSIRYNRFLLDELLSGRSQGTPLLPIIPYCLEHGEEGKEILLTLREWWRTGMNDIGTPRQDTISPIPEGISLLEAEKIAREREQGDGSMQKSVIEQFEAVL